jgi:hypothetical protein
MRCSSSHARYAARPCQAKGHRWECIEAPMPPPASTYRRNTASDASRQRVASPPSRAALSRRGKSAAAAHRQPPGEHSTREAGPVGRNLGGRIQPRERLHGEREPPTDRAIARKFGPPAPAITATTTRPAMSRNTSAILRGRAAARAAQRQPGVRMPRVCPDQPGGFDGDLTATPHDEQSTGASTRPRPARPRLARDCPSAPRCGTAAGGAHGRFDRSPPTRRAPAGR